MTNAPPPPGKPRLGRKLDELFGPPTASREPTPASSSAPIEELHPNRDQPRTRFDDARLTELAASISQHGVLEPILVRKRTQGGFEIIAGERRWRAAQRAGLRAVPIFVRDLAADAAFEAALVENLQREDLNPVETARAFERLVREFGLSQEAIAAKVSKDRTTIANALRLLKLPAVVLEWIEVGELSEGHGRALLGAPDVPTMTRLAAQAREGRWSVRELERHVRASAGASKGAKRAPAGKSANVRDLEQRLSRALGTKVRVADRRGKGHVEFAFSSYDELDRLVDQWLK